MSDDGEGKDDLAESSLFSVMISDVLGIGKAAEKLSPAATKIVEGMGALFSPFIESSRVYLEARARGAAQRHETESNIRQLSRMDKLLASQPVLAEAMKERLILTELRRQDNLHAALREAVDAANNSEMTGAIKLDEDFLVEWMEGVKDISNEEARRIWASLLAAAPGTPEGRISKPAIDLLRQFDATICRCFVDCAKQFIHLGLLSTKAPTDWAPFGNPLNQGLLVEMGVLETRGCSGIIVPGLGALNQVDLKPRFTGLLHTMEVYTFGQRARELAEALFPTPPLLEEEDVDHARAESFRMLVDDPLWSVAIVPDVRFDAKPRYIIAPLGVSSHSADEVIDRLAHDDAIEEPWKKVLFEYARKGRMQLAPE